MASRRDLLTLAGAGAIGLGLRPTAALGGEGQDPAPAGGRRSRCAS